MSARFALAESPSGVGIVAPVNYILVSNGDGTWDVAPEGSAGSVSSVFGRGGAVIAEPNDYSANQVSSAVDGPFVSDALAANKTAAANAQTTANTAVGNAATADAKAVAAQQPFKATYFVNSAFGGTQLGSMSNPFTTVAAAFAAAAALALTACVVNLPPGSTHVENVVFPSTGGSWELASEVGYLTNTIGTILSGTITINTTTASLSNFRITRLVVTGAVSGNSSGATNGLFLTQTRLLSTLTLTTSGVHNWVTVCQAFGPADPNRLTGNIAGAVNVDGRLLASSYSFEGGITQSPSVQWSQFWGCRFANTNFAFSATGAANTSAKFFGCTFDQAMTFTATAVGCSFILDSSSAGQLMTVGVTTTNCTVTCNNANTNNGSPNQTISNNVGATTLAPNAPAGMYRADVSQELLAAGTSGTAVLNVIYKDLTGTTVTKAVNAGLLITGALGSESSGSLVFQHQGNANISYSVTGIVTPGSVSIANAISVARVN